MIARSKSLSSLLKTTLFLACPVHPQLKKVFWEYAKRHSDTVRKHGTTPVFFMSWAYADVPEMTAQLAEQYTQAGNKNNAFVIPAGLAFAQAVKKRPELNLYANDKRHPSFSGTYLAAATGYGSLFKKSPIGLQYTAGIEIENAKFLQTIAGRRCRNTFASSRKTVPIKTPRHYDSQSDRKY